MELKLVRPVLVKCNYSNLILFHNGELKYIIPQISGNSFSIPMELILISPDSKDRIEVGDAFVFINNHPLSDGKPRLDICSDIFDNGNLQPEDKGSSVIREWKRDCCYKVIATYNQLSNGYINRFIDEYNTDSITDIKVVGEMMALHGNVLLPCSPNNNKSNSDMSIYKFYPELTEGYVTIVNADESVESSESITESDDEEWVTLPGLPQYKFKGLRVIDWDDPSNERTNITELNISFKYEEYKKYNL